MRDVGELGRRDAYRREQRAQRVAHDQDRGIIVEEDERAERHRGEHSAPSRGEESLDEAGETQGAATFLDRCGSALAEKQGTNCPWRSGTLELQWSSLTFC